MTEYRDQVERQRLELEAEEWSKGVKYLHLNNGVVERKYLSFSIFWRHVISSIDDDFGVL